MIGLKSEDIDKLYRDHVQDLFAYAMHLGFEREVCMDAIHDVFYKLCTQERAFQTIRNTRFYLLRALKNRLLDIYKQNKEHLSLSGEHEQNELSFSIQVTVEDRMIEQEEDKKIRDKVEALLDKLTDRQREIIYLRYMQNLDFEKISELMNLTVPGCRKLLHKGILRLRKTNMPEL